MHTVTVNGISISPYPPLGFLLPSIADFRLMYHKLAEDDTPLFGSIDLRQIWIIAYRHLR